MRTKWPSEESFFSEVGRYEGQRLDFKRKSPRDLQDTLVSLANAAGGLVIIGVPDALPRAVVGIDSFQDVHERVEEAARATYPPLFVEVVAGQVGERVVAIIHVKALRSGFVQTSSGRLLVRSGPTNRVLIGSDLAAFIAERSGSPAEDVPVEGASLADLDMDSVTEFVERRLRRRTTKDGLAQILRDVHLLQDDAPTLACLLHFGRAPQEFHRRLGIEFQRFAGTISGEHELRERRELTGRLVELVSAADRAIYDTMRRDSVIRGLLREEVPEYPTIAIREALLNAVGHRQYARTNSAVLVRLYDDALEIESPGLLPPSVDVDDLEHAQYSRNQRVMDLFHDLGLVEEAGEGIDRILAAMRDELLDPPIFEERAQNFLVRFSNSGLMTARDRVWLRDLGKVPGGTDGRLALVLMRRNGSVTNEGLRSARPVSADEGRRVLRSLVDAGLAEQRGERGGTHYVLAQEVDVDASPRDDEDVEAVVRYARRHGGVANEDVRRLLDVDRVAALRILEAAVALGVLRPVGERRWRRYHLP